MFKVNNRNTRTRREICSKLTTKTPKQRKWRRSGVFIVNFEHISYLVHNFEQEMPAGEQRSYHLKTENRRFSVVFSACKKVTSFKCLYC